MQIHSQDSLFRVHGIAPNYQARQSGKVRGLVLTAWKYVLAVFRREAEYQTGLRHYRELATMPDHLLKDIGVTPDSIRSERRRHVRGSLRNYMI